jgi:hypothetical protein
MDVNSMIVELRTEAERINRAIAALEPLLNPQRRLAKPPNWMREFLADGVVKAQLKRGTKPDRQEIGKPK